MKTRKRKEELTSNTKVPSSPRLLKLYNACRENAAVLLNEAELLLNNGHYPRAFFLALTALEEIGKSQIVADYYTGCVSREEFEKAFTDHKLKIAFNERYIDIQSGELTYDRSTATELWEKRLQALYVQCKSDLDSQKPSEMIRKIDAQYIIDQVKKEFSELISSEWLNSPRIGSKALLK